MSKIDKPGGLDKNLASDPFPEKSPTISTTDAIIVRIKRACTLVVRSITAIDDGIKFQNSLLIEVRNVHRTQVNNLLEQLDSDEITKRKLKSELTRKIEIVKNIIELHEGSHFEEGLKLALKILEISIKDF